MALNLIFWLFLQQFSRVFAEFPVVELFFDPNKEPDGLVEEWRKLITVQKNQTARFGQEFPVDERLYGNLKKCGHLVGPSADSTNFVKIHDIEIYSEIGHGTTFCRPGISLVRRPNETVNLSKDAQVFRHQCLNSMQTQSQNPSLAKIFRLMGAKIEVFESNVAHNSILSWARHIIRMIKRTEGYEDRWKFFLIIPNAFDIKFGRGVHIIADDVLQSIQLLHSEFRSKTFITVVRNSDLTLHKVAAEKFFFCQKLLDLWKIDDISARGAWNTLENRIKRNYQLDHFYVDLIDVLDGTNPVYYDRIPDVSILDSDCVHFSARGLSLLHGHIWNQLVEPGTRQKKWKPIVNPFFCPRPHCPYLITNENARYCLRPKQYSFEAKSQSRLLIALFLIMIMVLFIVLFTYTLCL